MQIFAHELQTGYSLLQELDKTRKAKMLVAQLTERELDVAKLVSEGFSASEIAEMLDSNETAIRVNLSRARKTVREALLKKYNYGVS